MVAVDQTDREACLIVFDNSVIAASEGDMLVIVKDSELLGIISVDVGLQEDELAGGRVLYTSEKWNFSECGAANKENGNK